MREVQVYIEGQRLDLFKDETISITSSIQNISDISKVYTDFSQSFTVPASKNNNQIFSHYYNNDITGGFLARNRVAASIEINHVPFRIGKIQLEGSEIKNNEADNYKITFYGDVVTLKDSFGTSKLADLNLEGLQLDVTYSNILSNLSDTSDLDYRFPLVSSDRIWNYGEGGSNDISTSGGAIANTELFPAIKVAKIFEAIETLADVTFNGLFLTDKRFTNLFTLWKNQKLSNFSLQEVPITFEVPGSTEFDVWHSDTLRTSVLQPINFGWNYAFNDANSVEAFDAEQYLKVWVTSSSVGSSWTLKIYKDGEFYTSLDAVVSGSLQEWANIPLEFNGGRYTFSILSADVVTIDEIDMKLVKEGVAAIYNSNTNDTTLEYETREYLLNNSETDSPFSTVNYVSLVESAPDMLISDYFSGILKMFNLTCYPLQDGTFNIEPLADWYRYGGELDITKYTIDDSIKVDRPKLYKNVNFEYKESKAFLNTEFKSEFDRNYGNLKESFDFDGGDFNVKVPFENLLFQRFTDTDLQVSYSMDKEEAGSSYVPAVTNFYLNEEKDCSFYFTDGFTPTLVSTYMPLGQDMEYSLQSNSSNFGLDRSTMTDLPIQNSLYGVYYKEYLESLFNNKTRQVTLRCVLPIIELTMLTLDDSIILRDKKYRIDSMKTDLTTGEVDLVLLSNWVETENNVPVGPTGPVRPTRPIKPIGGTIVRPVRPVKPVFPTKPYGGGGGTYKVEADVNNTFTTSNLTLPYTSDEPTNLEITASTNTTGSTRSDSFTITYYNPDGTEIGTEVIYVNQEAQLYYLLQENGDYLLTETYDKIILE